MSKNRNLKHEDDWATPAYVRSGLNMVYNFNFDPCPYQHDLTKWNGLEIDWGTRNFVNPPYSRDLKEQFVIKAVKESQKGKLCVVLLPVSTSTRLFQDHILPNQKEIKFVSGRIPFISINSKGEYVNWHLWDREVPKGAIQVKNTGMHDSMIVVFDGGGYLLRRERSY